MEREKYYLRTKIPITGPHGVVYDEEDVALFKSKSGRRYRQDFNKPDKGMKIIQFVSLKKILKEREVLKNYCGTYYDVYSTHDHKPIDLVDILIKQLVGQDFFDKLYPKMRCITDELDNFTKGNLYVILGESYELYDTTDDKGNFCPCASKKHFKKVI